MNVAVVGASNNPDRYSHQAVLLLLGKGHSPYPVHPSLDTVAGFAVYKTVSEIPTGVDTVTVYLGARNQGTLGEDILKSGVKRVIFNPGAENPALEMRLREAGVEVVEACTLVLLRTGQF
jgi:hypothetical protein